MKVVDPSNEQLGETIADQLETDSYSKLLVLKLGPYRIQVETTKTVTIDWEASRITISSDRASFPLQSEQ